MTLYDFVYQYFIFPHCKYYTIPSTLAWGLVLVVAVWGVFNFLKKSNIKIDRKFFYALLPFIAYGGWTRALRDHNIVYQGWQFCTPFIYLIIFGVTFLSLLFSLYLQKRFNIKYYKTMIVIGSILLLYNLTLTRIANPMAFFLILSIAGAWTLLFLLINRFKPHLLSKENAVILSSHLLDASSTFVALTYFGFYEQHVLPTFLINIFGPWIMFPLKIFVVWPVLYYIDKTTEDKWMRNFLKIVIFILGFALGVRDFLTVSMKAV